MFVEASTLGQTANFPQVSRAVNKVMANRSTDILAKWIVRKCGLIKDVSIAATVTQ